MNVTEAPYEFWSVLLRNVVCPVVTGERASSTRELVVYMLEVKNLICL